MKKCLCTTTNSSNPDLQILDYSVWTQATAPKQPYLAFFLCSKFTYEFLHQDILAVKRDVQTCKSIFSIPLTSIYILLSENLTSLESSGSSCNANRAHMMTRSAVLTASAGFKDLSRTTQSSPYKVFQRKKQHLVPLCKGQLELPHSFLF